MSTTVNTADDAQLFVNPAMWADMDHWHARLAELRRTQPILPVDDPKFDPFLALTRHADVLAISRDHENWLNTPQSVLMLRDQAQQMLASGLVPASLVHLDGVHHRQHRQVTNDWFKPAAVGRRQERIDQIADLFIDRMRSFDGACDFAKDIAAPYTLRVIMDIYGVPESDEPLMLELTQGLFGAADPEFMGDAATPEERGMQAIMTFIQYFNEITQDRKANPADDLATVIANGEIDGQPLGDVERLWYYIIVATAGHDTTSFALAGGMQALLAHPDQWALLCAEGDYVVQATDEIIRWTTPVRHFMRYAAHDTTYKGFDIPAGGRVLLSYPSANRDEDVFERAMSFDITRTDADKLLSFGMGAHFCLGAQFARREIRTMLGKLRTQLASIEPDGDASWSESAFVSGVKHLPIRYTWK